MWFQLKKRIRLKNVIPKFDRVVINLITEEVVNITAEDQQKKIKKKMITGHREMIRKGNNQFIVDLPEELADSELEAIFQEV